MILNSPQYRRLSSLMGLALAGSILTASLLAGCTKKVTSQVPPGQASRTEQDGSVPGADSSGSVSAEKPADSGEDIDRPDDPGLSDPGKAGQNPGGEGGNLSSDGSGLIGDTDESLRSDFPEPFESDGSGTSRGTDPADAKNNSGSGGSPGLPTPSPLPNSNTGSVVPVGNTVPGSSAAPSPDGRTGSQLDQPYAVNGIVLVNKQHWVSRNYRPVPDQDNQWGLQASAKSAFASMKAAAAAEGLSLRFVSGYRTYEYQDKLYSDYARRDPDGFAAANMYSAKPGQSEHQTGLALDIDNGAGGVGLTGTFAHTKEGKWLWANAWKFGWILRYPQGKTHITGYIFEPWHYRFIGVSAAKNFGPNSSLTLEEYLGVTQRETPASSLPPPAKAPEPTPVPTAKPTAVPTAKPTAVPAASSTTSSANSAPSTASSSAASETTVTSTASASTTTAAPTLPLDPTPVPTPVTEVETQEDESSSSSADAAGLSGETLESSPDT